MINRGSVMIRVQLETASGERTVVTGSIPTFNPMPDVITWGLRVFYKTDRLFGDRYGVIRHVYREASIVALNIGEEREEDHETPLMGSACDLKIET